MISHVLDTNAVIALLSGGASKLSERIISQPIGVLALPTIVVHELYFGAFRSQRVERNLEALKH